jgi:hypothetical protein
VDTDGRGLILEPKPLSQNHDGDDCATPNASVVPIRYHGLCGCGLCRRAAGNSDLHHHRDRPKAADQVWFAVHPRRWVVVRGSLLETAATGALERPRGHTGVGQNLPLCRLRHAPCTTAWLVTHEFRDGHSDESGLQRYLCYSRSFEYISCYRTQSTAIVLLLVY